MLLKFSQGEELKNQHFRSHKMEKNSTHHFKSLDSWSITLLRILLFFQLNTCSFFLRSSQRLGPDPWSWSAQCVIWSTHLNTANPATPCTQEEPSHQNDTLLLAHVFPPSPLWLWIGLTVARFILIFKKNTSFSLSHSLKLKVPSEVQLPWDICTGRKSKLGSLMEWVISGHPPAFAKSCQVRKSHMYDLYQGFSPQNSPFKPKEDCKIIKLKPNCFSSPLGYNGRSKFSQRLEKLLSLQELYTFLIEVMSSVPCQGDQSILKVHLH